MSLSPVTVLLSRILDALLGDVILVIAAATANREKSKGFGCHFVNGSVRRVVLGQLISQLSALAPAAKLIDMVEFRRHDLESRLL